MVSAALVRLPQNVPPVDAEKIAVSGHRPPPWRRVPQQFFQPQAAHFSGMSIDGTGVIDHDVLCSFRAVVNPLAAAHKNHRVKWGIPFQLPEEKKVSRSRHSNVSRQ